MFIPPQYHERFIALNRICSQRRSDNAELKTQIRFGQDDLIVLTKIKGSEEPYKIVNLREFAGDEFLPEFDMSLKWRIQEDRPPRRRVATHESPARRQNPESSEEQRTITKNLTRQHSDDRTADKRNKKQRKEVIENSEDPTRRNNDMDTTQ